MLRIRTVLSGWVGGPGLQTFYVTGGAEDAAEALTCVTAVHVWWNTYAKSLLTNDAVANISPQVDVISAASGDITGTLVVAAPAAVGGNGGADSAPPACAALLNLRTANFIEGRHVRGRVYISPLAAVAITADGVINAALIASMAESVDTLVTQIGAVGSLVVWHRPVGGAGGLAMPVLSGDLNAKIAVLTSRRD